MGARRKRSRIARAYDLVKSAFSGDARERAFALYAVKIEQWNFLFSCRAEGCEGTAVVLKPKRGGNRAGEFFCIFSHAVTTGRIFAHGGSVHTGLSAFLVVRVVCAAIPVPVGSDRAPYGGVRPLGIFSLSVRIARPRRSSSRFYSSALAARTPGKRSCAAARFSSVIPRRDSPAAAPFVAFLRKPSRRTKNGPGISQAV